MVTLNGLMQAPGGPEEDPPGGVIIAHYRLAGKVRTGNIGA